MDSDNAEEKENKQSLPIDNEGIARMEKPSGSNYQGQYGNFRGRRGWGRNISRSRRPFGGYQARGSYRGGMKCWNCNRGGHMARDCYYSEDNASAAMQGDKKEVRKHF